eukprot:TRINITY_DN3084_c0_g2_i1.p1 TRINITY_DN3084_c0_g2~~TRINITY_DN3084_c0_g2_i1.p1  ORF type:complete len:179 (-),score=36.43 TRINITY_DN3084_c0_g2_i1:29-565(-)
MKILVFAFLVVVAIAPTAPDQCDQRWAYTKLGKTNTTICENYQLGSLLTCLTYFTSQRDRLCSQEHRWCYPHVLNDWLNANDGWDGTTGIKWKVFEKLNIRLLECTTDYRQIIKWYNERIVERSIILNIHDGNLWVFADFVYPERISISNPRDTRESTVEKNRILKACRIEDGNWGKR